MFDTLNRTINHNNKEVVNKREITYFRILVTSNIIFSALFSKTKYVSFVSNLKLSL